MKTLLPLGLLLFLVGCDSRHAVLPMGNITTPQPSPAAPAPESRHKILITAGQSNMVGFGMLSEYPAADRVAIVGGTRRGPGYAAAADLASTHPLWMITVVQCAVGATVISEWVKGGDQYQGCVDAVKAQHGDIIGVLFYQGESDAFDTLNANWGQQFGSMVASMRADLGLNSLPVIFAQIAIHGGGTQQNQDNWTAFKQLQADVAIAHTSMVKTDDVAHLSQDDVHLDEGSCTAIGQRFAIALMNLMIP